MASFRSTSLDERESLITSKAAEAGKASIDGLVSIEMEALREGWGHQPFLRVMLVAD